MGGFPQGVPQDLKNLQANAEKAKMDKEALKRQKELIALQKKAQLAEKNKIALNKAAAVFDSERISIAAALKATYDKETRIRLEALMAIAEDDGATALARIGELAAFQKSADLDKLAGLKTISSATLEALNTQLLKELGVINTSKMAEADKEAARQIAFGKYNAAITAAGTLADKASYTERVQIQLTEIERLASLSKTENAFLTANTLREQAELGLIDRVAKAQAAADAARLAALNAYIFALSAVGKDGAAVKAVGTVAATKLGSGQALTKEEASLLGISDFDTIIRDSFGGGSASGGAYASSGFPGAEKNNGTTVVNLTNNFGIVGDPNSAAEAIDQVITNAVQRGTLKNSVFSL
jgi:hypothetical protein